MNKRCVIICSGGLDSTTAAAHARYIDELNPILLHFLYDCRAESREVEAIKNIASFLECDYEFANLSWLKELGGSSLTNPDSSIATSIEGAEYPHEWVPARNFVMVAHAAAYCDAHGIDKIYMGLNLEEGAVYPDNTVEFYERLNAVLPLATLVRPVIKMPLARMMKWQIVKHAYEIGAPIHLSWSCYLSETLHCGSCGPCYMRRTAHSMAGIQDTVDYINEQKRGAV